MISDECLYLDEADMGVPADVVEGGIELRVVDGEDMYRPIACMFVLTVGAAEYETACC